MKPHLFFLSIQIWKNLPHLKAVVIFQEPPLTKMTNVYTVWVEGSCGAGGVCVSLPSSPGLPALSHLATDGGVHGSGE